MTDIPLSTPITADGRLGAAAQHPGFTDPAYLRRRQAIAAPARGHQVGQPSPPVAYTEAEHRTWRTVHRAVWSAQAEHACRAVLEAREQAPIPADRIPQHAEVGARLRSLTGFDFTLAAGVVANKRFLGSMSDGFFHAVQFVRHPAVPLFTPEPDVLHDVLGHGIHLAHPRFANLYRLIGQAAKHAQNPGVLQMISDVYWFTLEYGVLQEQGRPKAYGAALLSSYGEIRRLHRCAIRPLDIGAVLATSYTTTGYQPVLFSAHSLEEVTSTVAAFLDKLDDDSTRHGPGGPPHDRAWSGRRRL
ncbi:phenylalanine 4-monooxygenase [Streptomyces sp. NPDC096033]|uniref:phenylalanine 4-monooxygenase n=1 Tax=Streptomyces sp. NPDC096033 TaxID=3366071 RepID=UPI0038238923